MEVMNAGVHRPSNNLQSRSTNAARCCRNLQSPLANRLLTAGAIFFLVPTGILKPSCPGDNGPFVASSGTFVIAPPVGFANSRSGWEMPRLKLGRLQRLVDDPSQLSGAEGIAQTIKCTQSYCFQVLMPVCEPREDHHRNVASHITRNS